MRKYLSTSCATAMALALLAGCSDVSEPVAPLEASYSVMAEDSATDPWHPDEARSTELARRVPGFGGFSFDSAGNMVIHMKTPENAQAVGLARALLSPYHESQRGGWRHGAGRAEVIVRRAAFTFLELRRFRSLIDSDVFTTPGVSSMDLDEWNNRLVIRLQHAGPGAARPAIEASLDRHRVPREAVVFETETPQVIYPPCNVQDENCNPDPCSADPASCEETQPDETDPCTLDPGACGPDPCSVESGSCVPSYSTMPAPNLSLRERIRPVLGGTGIKNLPESSLPEMSTLGFPVYYCPPPAGTWGTGGSTCAYYYAVTSHQTFNYAKVQGNVKFYQPTSTTSDGYIGPEAYDPPWHTTAFAIRLEPQWSHLGTTCQKYTSANSVVCRRSDVALIRAQGPSLSFGYLVRPVNRYPDGGDYGARQYDVDPNATSMQIAWEGVAERGHLVEKIGATTGWRVGTVQNRCVDKVRQGSGVYEPYNMVFRCQTEVQWTRSANGDSGGPVFRRESDGKVMLLGIHSAANGAHLGTYASLANIRADFGIRNDNFIHFDTFGPPPR